MIAIDSRRSVWGRYVAKPEHTHVAVLVEGRKIYCLGSGISAGEAVRAGVFRWNRDNLFASRGEVSAVQRKMIAVKLTEDQS